MAKRTKDEFDRLLDRCTGESTVGDPAKVNDLVNGIRSRIPKRRTKIWLLPAAVLLVILLLTGSCLLIASYFVTEPAFGTAGGISGDPVGTDGDVYDGETTYTTTTAQWESRPDTDPETVGGERMATFRFLCADGQEVQCQEKVYDLDSLIRRWMELSGRTDLMLMESAICYTPTSEEPMVVSVRFEYREGSEYQGEYQLEYLRASILASYPEFDRVDIEIR